MNDAQVVAPSEILISLKAGYKKSVRKSSSKISLQVGGEIILEGPTGEAEARLPLIRCVMERAAGPAVALSVPLDVEAKSAGRLGRGAL